MLDGKLSGRADGCLTGILKQDRDLRVKIRGDPANPEFGGADKHHLGMVFPANAYGKSAWTKSSMSLFIRSVSLKKIFA